MVSIAFDYSPISQSERFTSVDYMNTHTHTKVNIVDFFICPSQSRSHQIKCVWSEENKTTILVHHKSRSTQRRRWEVFAKFSDYISFLKNNLIQCILEMGYVISRQIEHDTIFSNCKQSNRNHSHNSRVSFHQLTLPTVNASTADDWEYCIWYVDATQFEMLNRIWH